jgi:predicted nucleotidyltransferase
MILKKDLKKIEQEMQQLLKFKEELALVYIYGSAVRKKEYNDIDVLVIYDDTEKKGKELLISLEMEKIKKSTKLSLHFQSLKMFSAWWGGVISGEAWILTSLDNCLPLYDKYDVIKRIQSMMKKEVAFSREEKAEKLLDYSDRLSIENRELLLKSVSSLVDAATNVCQIFLILLKNKMIIDKNKIVEEMKKQLGFGESIEHYKNLIDLESKIMRGVLTEFSGENLDFYLEKVKELILKAEKEMRKINACKSCRA